MSAGGESAAAIDDPILTRTLTWRRDDGSEIPVVVRFARPRALAGGDCLCAWQVTGFGDDEVRATMGVDSVQAMLLALQEAGIHLSGSAAAREGRLFWLEEGNPPGLPMQFHYGPAWRDDL